VIETAGRKCFVHFIMYVSFSLISEPTVNCRTSVIGPLLAGCMIECAYIYSWYSYSLISYLQSALVRVMHIFFLIGAYFILQYVLMWHDVPICHENIDQSVQ